MALALLKVVFNSLQVVCLCLPRGLKKGILHLGAFFLERMVPQSRRQVARENLARMFPGEDWILKAFWQHLFQTCAYLFVLYGSRTLAKKFLKQRVRLEGLEYWNEALALGRGACFLSSHVGHWEIMGAKGAEAKPNQLWLVTKALKPRFFHQFLEQRRLALGLKATYEPRVMERVAEVLGQGHTVGWVLDQYAGPPISVRVPFFGTCVGTSLGLAMTARRYKAPILPVENFREKDGSWTVRIHPMLEVRPLEGRSIKAALAEDTASFSLIIEDMIRRHPEQWLWTHKRFKGDLSNVPRSGWGQRLRKGLVCFFCLHALTAEAAVPYAGGEHLEYSIQYFGIPAGRCDLKAHLDVFQGRKVYRLEAHATSVAPFAWFYKLEDALVSLQDADGLYSHFFKMDLQESSQTRKTSERYLHEEKKLIRDDDWKHKQKQHFVKDLELEMEPFGQDSFSALYYVRTLPLKEGVPETFHVTSEGKRLVFTATRLPGHKLFRCQKARVRGFPLKLQTRWYGVMEQTREDSLLWLSDDSKRFPLQLEAKLKLGALVAKLKRVHP